MLHKVVDKLIATEVRMMHCKDIQEVTYRSHMHIANHGRNADANTYSSDCSTSKTPTYMSKQNSQLYKRLPKACKSTLPQQEDILLQHDCESYTNQGEGVLVLVTKSHSLAEASRSSSLSTRRITLFEAVLGSDSRTNTLSSLNKGFRLVLIAC